MKKHMHLIVIIFLAVVLGAIFFLNSKREQSKATNIKQLKEQIAPYNQEIKEINSDLKQREKEINTMNDPTGLIIGFVPTSVKDFNDISTLVKSHKIKPVIILDCSLEEDVLRDMVKEVVDKKYEVVLSGMTFNGSVLDMSDEIKDLLVKSGYDKELAFFLRKNYNSEENRSLLKEHDYENYILYNEQLQAGVLETGKAYICYGFYRNPEQFSKAVADIIESHSMVVACFEFSEIKNGTINLSDINNFLTMTDSESTSEKLNYVKLDAAFKTVVNRNRMTQKKKEEFKQYKVDKEARIEELESKISEIYSQWDKN